MLIKIIKTTEKGLPLGFYTSQWFANFYLQDFDHYVKQQLKIKYYIRYMDDMVLFDANKEHLHQIKNQIEKYLNNKLHLTIKENWQVFLMHNKNEQGRFLDFMGFRFYRNRITLRRKMVLKAMRKARRICKKGYATHYDARQLLTYKGWIQKTNTFNLKWYIVYRISFYNLRKIVSKHDKKINQGKI